MTRAVFHNDVNMRFFDYSGLMTGDFSNESSTGFTLTSGNHVLDVSGSGFAYSHGQPISGTITDVDAQLKGQADFSFSDMNLSVSQLAQDIGAQDLGALRDDFFGGSDKILAGKGNDHLWGYTGSDLLNGGAGDDLLVGGKGHDKLMGGEGRDYFRFDHTGDTRATHADVIMDLQTGDFVDVGRIDADVNTDGDQAFEIVNNFSHHAGELTLSYDAGTDMTTIAMDVDGDGVADAAIQAVGDHTDFSSFVL